MLWRFYRRLWQRAEADRQAADDSLRRMGRATLGVLEALDVDDHPNPAIRGEIRKLRRAAENAPPRDA
jgi:hypothetical protein